MDTSLYHWKRKFPGPAGLLPLTAKGHDESHFTKVELNAMLKHEFFVKNFTKGTWAHMKHVIPNIREVLKMHSLKRLFEKARLPEQQIPCRAEYIVGLITTLTNNKEDAFVELEDETGCIGVAICRDLYKKYRREIIVGSALILRNVVVFSTMIGEDRDMWNLFVNASNSNLEYIFSSKDEGVTVDVTKIPILQMENDQSLKTSTITQDNLLLDGCSLEDIFGDMSDDDILTSMHQAGDSSGSSLKLPIPDTSNTVTNLSASTTVSRLRQDEAGKILGSGSKAQIDGNKNDCSRISTHPEYSTKDIAETTTSAYFCKETNAIPCTKDTRCASEILISNSGSVVSDVSDRTLGHVSQKPIEEAWNEMDFDDMLADFDDD